MQQSLPFTATRVLVVDDHEISRCYAVAALRRNGCAVRQAASYGRALKLALDWLPHAIITDFNLGAESGTVLLARILSKWPADVDRPRCVLISAACGDEPLSAGPPIDCVLEKPARTAALLAAVSTTPLPTRPAGEDPRLDSIFRRELRQHLPELEHCLAEKDHRAAHELLHQLTASSAVCAARDLENACRSLDRACRTHATAEQLARDYLALVAAARRYLLGVPD